MKPSLLWRIAAPFVVLIGVVAGSVGFVVSGELRNSYLERTRTALFSEARLVRDEMTPLLNDPVATPLNDDAHRLAALLGVRITVVMSDGLVVAESERPPGTLENHLNRPEVQQALLRKEAAEIRYSSTLGYDLLYAAVPVEQEGRVTAVVRLATPLSSIQANLNRLYASVALAAGLAVAAALLLAYLITRRTLRPLNELHNAALQIGRGEIPEVPQPTDRDELSRLQGAFRSMAESLRSQIGALDAERGKLEAVLENMGDGVLIADPQGRVTLINPAAMRMFAVEGDEAVDRSLIEVVRQHQFMELWRRCRNTRMIQALSLELGAERTFVQAIATPLGQEMEGATLLVFQDLTRMRRLETVRRDFVSNVSHELRTPLASLRALVETLQEGALEDPPAAQRFLSQMQTEIDNLTQMVQELLDLSRIESGRAPLEIRSVDPCELLNESVERMRLQAERAGLSVTLDCVEVLPSVRADNDRMQQVLVNLIHNAIKFTRPGGKIVVSAVPREREVVFCVRDSGVGISPEDLPRIFERFYKADRSRSGGGTGLGLSIVRHTVESHGGQVWAESEIDRGSAFYFTLPAG